MDAIAEELINNLNPLDPFTPLEKEKITSNIPALPPKEIDDKDLQGVPPHIVEAIKNYRGKKIAYEKPIPEIQKRIKDVEIYKKWLEMKYQEALDNQAKISDELQKKRRRKH